MRPKLTLRIAAGITLFHAIGHTRAILTWQKPNGPVPMDLIRKMQETHFVFRGHDSTMAAFYTGNGLAATVLLLLIASVLWLVADLENRSATKILWPIGFSLILLTVDELIFFFPMAVLISLVAASLVFFALFKLNKS